MSALKLALSVILDIFGVVALTFVAGLVNPSEKVNGLWLVVAAECCREFPCQRDTATGELLATYSNPYEVPQAVLSQSPSWGSRPSH